MFDISGFRTAEGFFIISGFGLALWMALQWIPALLLGKSLKAVLDEITLPESVLFGLFSIGAAIIVHGILSA